MTYRVYNRHNNLMKLLQLIYVTYECILRKLFNVKYSTNLTFKCMTYTLIVLRTTWWFNK